MEIELKENQSQLETHYGKVPKLDFKLKEMKNLLEKTDDDIAAMTKDGVWLGAFNVKELDEEHFTDESLSNEQRLLRQKVLKAKLDLEKSTEERDTFTNDSKILLSRAEVERALTEVVSDKVRLAQIEQLGKSTKANLYSGADLEILKSIQSPIAENLPELTLWEILSLTKGYNFFETRGQSLASKLELQEERLQDLEKTLLGHNDALASLDENLGRAKSNYGFYHEQFKTFQSQKNSSEIEIAKVEFELSYSTEMVKKLEDRVKALRVAVNEKKTRLTELTRQLDIAKEAYTILASKIEEARIAKAMELGEVKVVSIAFEPQYPVAPRRKFIVAIAGVVRLMLGVFMAFCLEFWQKSEHG
jgi:chromosome segregation ATPase